MQHSWNEYRRAGTREVPIAPIVAAIRMEGAAAAGAARLRRLFAVRQIVARLLLLECVAGRGEGGFTPPRRAASYARRRPLKGKLSAARCFWLLHQRSELRSAGGVLVVDLNNRADKYFGKINPQ